MHPTVSDTEKCGCKGRSFHCPRRTSQRTSAEGATLNSRRAVQTLASTTRGGQTSGIHRPDYALAAVAIYFAITLSKKFWLPALDGAYFWMADVACFVFLPATLVAVLKLPLKPGFAVGGFKSRTLATGEAVHFVDGGVSALRRLAHPPIGAHTDLVALAVLTHQSTGILIIRCVAGLACETPPVTARSSP